MSFAGHVFDMISRIKYNNSLVESPTERYKRIRRSFDHVHSRHGTELKRFTDIPPEKLELIRKEVRNKLIHERRIAMTKTILTSIIILVIVGFVLYKILDARELLGFIKYWD